MSGLSPDGLTIKTQAEIEAELQADHRSLISPTIDVSPSSPDGLRIGIFARSLAIAYELVAAVYAAIDPAGAEEDALDRLSAITGTTRESATASRVTCTCVLAAGTYNAGTLHASVVGFPDRRFANLESVVSSGGSNAVLFAAETLGPVAAPSGTLTQIASPVSGWSSVTNAADAVLGLAIESDPALRVRRAIEVAAPGSANVNGIRAVILRDVPLVETCSVIENDTDLTVDTVPPHSVETVVFGPVSPSPQDNQDVAEAIFRAKGSGAGTSGGVTKTVVDDMGFSHTIKFTRPTEETTSVAITLEYDLLTYAGDTAVQFAIQALSPLLPGRDVAWAACVSAAMGVAGVLRVSSIELDALGTFTDKTITTRQFATIDAGDVTVTSSPGAP